MSAVIHGFAGSSIIQPNERKGIVSTSLPNVAHLIQVIAAPILYTVRL